MAGMKAYRFVGFNQDVWLPDGIDVIIDIVPSSVRNVRSNQTSTAQTSITAHDTGNPNSDAWGERNYLHSGAGGRSVGYNFAFDDKRIIQLTPLNEVTWAAGTTNGNRYSWHAEQCLKADWTRSLEVGAALHGGLIAAKGWDASKALVQHNVWYGKHCPAQIRNRGVWPQFVNMVAAAATKAKGAATGGIVPVPDGWPYPDPVKPAFWDALMADGATHALDGKTVWYRANELYRVKHSTKRQQFAIQDDRVVGPAMEPGTEFRSAAIGQSVSDGETYVITPALTRVRLDALEYVEEQAA